MDYLLLKWICIAYTASGNYLSGFLIPISMQPHDVNFKYFKLELFDRTKFEVGNIKGWQRYRD